MMRSKWHRNIVAVTLVAVFAAGTVAVSGGYQPIEIGKDSWAPVQGTANTTVTEYDRQVFAVTPTSAYIVGALIARAISPFRRGGSMPTGMLDESIFD